MRRLLMAGALTLLTALAPLGAVIPVGAVGAVGAVGPVGSTPESSADATGGSTWGGALAAQTDRVGAAPARVPFGPGERAEYNVSLGIFGNVGKGSMEVVGTEDVHGHATYHLRFDLKGRVLVGSVDDTFQSWLDIDQFFARRFHKRQDEISYHTNRTYDFFPDRMEYVRQDGRETGELATAEPLDEVSFLYFVRTLDLEPGRTYTFNRYYKGSGNPVTLKVLRREMMGGTDGSEVPVVVVQPIIRTSGLFGEGGKAEVYFTDDWRRILVKMTSKVPIIGRLGLTLTGYTAGELIGNR